MPPRAASHFFPSRDREGAVAASASSRVFNGAVTPADRFTLAQPRVDEACRLLQRGSGFAIASCLPVLEDARRLLAESSGALPHDGSAAALAAALARAGNLAHTAASFYRECLWLTAADSRAYTAAGIPAAVPPPNRTLVEA